jgi:hypothetical protein
MLHPHRYRRGQSHPHRLLETSPIAELHLKANAAGLPDRTIKEAC